MTTEFIRHASLHRLRSGFSLGVAFPCVFVDGLYEIVEAVLTLLGPFGVMFAYDFGRIAQHVRNFLEGRADANEVRCKCVPKSVRMAIGDALFPEHRAEGLRDLRDLGLRLGFYVPKYVRAILVSTARSRECVDSLDKFVGDQQIHQFMVLGRPDEDPPATFLERYSVAA